MKLYPDSKVYIQCPANVQTGGPESLHQLASALISLGVRVYIRYSKMEGTTFDPENPVHDAYKKYHVPYTFKPEDNQQNVFISPETNTLHLYAFKKVRRVIWWMSIDNYLKNILLIIDECLNAPLSKPMRNYFTFHDADKKIEHWGQSEYVCQFLKLNGVANVKTVETHMSQIFLSRASQIDLSMKKNIVAFNPNKGFKITQYLMKFAPYIDWRPIKDMTPAQVQELLAQAKVYIDFGEFPGRERLPREAAISGCVVITGKRGAAGNDIDINIPDEFKFDLKATPKDIVKKIHEVFENFAEAYDAQRAFRDKELNAQKNFVAEVIQAFEIKKFPPPSSALIQGVNEKSFLLAQELFKSKDTKLNFIVDDVLAATKVSDDMILREQNRNYLRVGKNLVEIITRDDAKFLYLEGRIKKFALFEPTDSELADLKDFYEADDANILIFNR